MSNLPEITQGELTADMKARMNPSIEDVLDVLQPGVVVAGGCASFVYSGIGQYDDIDLYSLDGNSIGGTYRSLVRDMGYIRGANKQYLEKEGRNRVNVIDFVRPKSLNEMLGNFDITVAQFAFDKTHWYATPQATRDIEYKVLRLTEAAIENRNNYSVCKRMARIEKYNKKGFAVDQVTLNQIFDISRAEFAKKRQGQNRNGTFECSVPENCTTASIPTPDTEPLPRPVYRTVTHWSLTPVPSRNNRFIVFVYYSEGFQESFEYVGSETEARTFLTTCAPAGVTRSSPVFNDAFFEEVTDLIMSSGGRVALSWSSTNTPPVEDFHGF